MNVIIILILIDLQIRHETIRLSVIQRLEEYFGLLPSIKPDPRQTMWDDEEHEDGDALDLNPQADSRPFIDLCKRRFLWYFTTYLNTIDSEQKKHKDGKNFQRMPFESSENGMVGSFHYSALRTRLMALKEHLGNELVRWAIEGQQALKACKGKPVNLQHQFAQIRERNQKTVFNVEMELIDGNPFAWRLTLMGKHTSRLEGGVFEIHVHLSPQFPDEQPRAILQRPIFHYRVAEDGFLCYFVRKPDDMKSHIDAIIEALEDDSIPYDPRTTVRPEASTLFWGTAEDKKQYNRKLRRSVEETSIAMG